jgi:predicted nucleic acid-binding protein
MSSGPPPGTPPIPEPCGVYLEASALVDLADSTEVRHNAALPLLALFQRYQNSGILWVATSLWAVTECHSTLYEKELRRLGTAPPVRAGKRRGLRETLPPIAAALAVATNQVDALLNTLQSTTAFLLLPDTNRDAVPLFDLTMRFAKEAALYAPDSIHAAIALGSGDCQILISDDLNFLDKMDSCQASFVVPFRQTQFSELATPPTFNAYGILPTVSELPSHHARASAMQALNALGFH